MSMMRKTAASFPLLLAMAVFGQVPVPDTIDEAAAQRRGVPVEQVQLENAIRENATLKKQIADIKDRLSIVNSDIDRAIQIKLNQDLPEWSADNLPLEKILDRISQQNAMHWIIHWKALQAGGIEGSMPLTVNLQGVSIRAGLNAVLSAAGEKAPLDFVIIDHVIHISTKADLAACLAASKANLTGLPAGPQPNADAARKVEDQLSAVIFPAEFVAENQPLERVINDLSDQAHLKLSVDWDALKTAGVERTDLVSLDVRDIPLRSLIATILFRPDAQSALDFALIDGAPRISTRAELAKIAAVVPVPAGLPAPTAAEKAAARSRAVSVMQVQLEGVVQGNNTLKNQLSDLKGPSKITRTGG